MSHIKDCLIVAAGKGTRLKANGDVKPLVELCGIPLIERAIRTAVQVGVENFVVVTGYKAVRLEAFLDTLRDQKDFNIKTVYNPDYSQPNGLSVQMGAPFLRGEFYLAMCDHIVEASIYRCLANASLPEHSVALGVDYRLDNPDVDIDDVTKVSLQGAFINNIGKELQKYDAFDTGVFRAGPALFAAIEKSKRNSGDCSISGGMKVLAKYNQAIAVDVGQSRWIDVDSPEMFTLAHQWLEGSDNYFTHAQGTRRCVQ